MTPDRPAGPRAAGRVVVVGLGPAGADLLLPAARSALERAPVRLARTARHPAVEELRAEGLTIESFDPLYESGADLESVYASIARAVIDAAVAAEAGAVDGVGAAGAGTAGAGVAAGGDASGGTGEGASPGVAYAVPGNPAVAERTVELLREAAARGEVALEIVPGLSFAELAWARVGVDPSTGARLVDGHRFVVEAAGASGPLLITQCDSLLVLSDVKLALLEVVGPQHPVTVLARLGLPGETVSVVALEDLGRSGVEPDHLTSLFVDVGHGAVAPETARLLELAERLRSPGGCPWDAEQDHRSLTRYLLEEAYEVVDAVEALPPGAGAAPGSGGAGTAGGSAYEGLDGDARDAYDALAGELGDLLYQVVFHSVMAREAGAFTFADVARGIHDKLVRRHPHVFGAVEAESSSDVVRNWEQIKKEERASESIVDGIPKGLPALIYSHKLLRKAASIGLVAPGAVPADLPGALDDLDRAVARLREPAGGGVEGDAHGDVPGGPPAGAVGEVLAATVAAARALGVDGESALHARSGRFLTRFRRMERLAADGVDLSTADPETVAALWRRSATQA